MLLLDRAEFPRPKACAGGLTAKTLQALRYRVDPVVRRWVHSMELEDLAGRTVHMGRKKPAVCAMTVREELDRFCLEQTRARGAVFQRVGALQSLEQEEQGITLRCNGGEPIHARFVIGADGVHSTVRRLISGDASWFRKVFAVEANVPYRSGESYPLLFDFRAAPGGYGWLFPRDNHVNVGLYIAEPGEGPNPGAAVLSRYIAERCGGGMPREHSRPVGQYLGMGAAQYQPTRGTRTLLAGDAAGFVDPLTGEGIFGAVRSGQAAAAAVLGALRLADTAPPRPKAIRAEGVALEDGFAKHSQALRNDLEVAAYAAERFYADPAAGFRLLHFAPLRWFALHTYAEGTSLGRLLRAVRLARKSGLVQWSTRSQPA